MAEFCNQCGGRGELAGETTHKNWKRGLANVVICEGCGAIQVDPKGNCVSDDCLKNGHKEEK